MNADGDSCPAAGMHPDEALDRRRTFGTMRRLLRLIDGADGIGVHARMVRDDITAQMWVTLTPADARRMAAELIEIADLQDGRG